MTSLVLRRYTFFYLNESKLNYIAMVDAKMKGQAGYNLIEKVRVAWLKVYSLNKQKEEDYLEFRETIKNLMEVPLKEYERSDVVSKLKEGVDGYRKGLGELSG